MTGPAQLLDYLRREGIVTARELAQALGVSQPTISRLLRRAGSSVVVIGKARARRYAASRNVRGLGTCWPLYRIDQHGKPERVGILHALYGEQFLFAVDHQPDWLRDEFADGLFPELPWFMEDMRPQGFLGRLFAHRVGTTLGLRKELTLWSDDDVVTALLLRGQDTAGSFVLGEGAVEAALAEAQQPVSAAHRGAAYVHLAEAVTAGEVPGSSAAGEQPKFTTCVETDAGGPQHVIVKFTEAVTDQPAARRWADLLMAEHVASRVLASHGIDAAQTEVITSGDRWFLQSTRFDRVGQYGRTGFLSLASIDDACGGSRDTWAKAAARLRQAWWITADTAERIQLCWWFGRMIGNTDMHFGNLGFHFDLQLPLRLAPIYDMLPMYFRPTAGGGIQRPPFTPPPPVPEHLELWQQGCRMALSFWHQVQDQANVSKVFHEIASGQQEALASLFQRFG